MIKIVFGRIFENKMIEIEVGANVNAESTTWINREKLSFAIIIDVSSGRVVFQDKAYD